MANVTIYDVAEAAGVSTATVSKVLSGQRYVSDRTRARVLEAVERLHYVPNVAARGLAGARTDIIAAVISYDPDYLFSDPHMLRILHGAGTVVAAHHCALLLSTGSADEEPLIAHQRLLSQRHADGVLVEGSLGEAGFRLLQTRGYPVVAIGYSEGVSCVHADDRGGARAMTEQLLALGHRRIGVISGPANDRLAMGARLDGYREALAAAGLDAPEELVTYGTFRTPSGYAGAAALMAEADPPTALFAFNDRMALGAIAWLHEQGLRVPEDVSVAGFDDIPDAARGSPPLSTVRQGSKAQGEEAARLLFALIEAGAPHERQEIVLPTELRLRASTGVVSEKAGG